ncbi:MAG: thioredoxin family protein [Actinomycetia bacterium]|nr:thioredoxin family protein [Actinomycetes bacterium]
MTGYLEITLLTQHDCNYCHHAKDVLGRIGQDYPLRITEINLASEKGQNLASRAGVMFAPGVLVDGEPFSFGRLSERKLRRALDKRAASRGQRIGRRGGKR